MFLNRLSLLPKIILAPAIIGLFALGYIAFTYSVARDNTLRLEELKTVEFLTLDIATSNVGLLEKITESLNSGATTGEQDPILATDAIAARLRQNIEEIRRLKPERGPVALEIERLFNDYFTLAKQVSLTMASGKADFSALQGDIGQMQERQQRLSAQLKTFKETTQQEFSDSLDETSRTTKSAIIIGVISAFAFITISLLLSFYVANTIRRSMVEVVGSFQSLANGNLRTRNKIDTSDEIGELVSWFNTFVAKLQQEIQGLASNAANLDYATNDMSDLARDSEQLLATERKSIFLVADRIGLITQQVEQIAESANSASCAAQEAHTVAGDGQRAIHDTIGCIHNLAEQINLVFGATQKIDTGSKEINSIVDMIKNISEQTNLLSLNAAIEAARAGEQGRGFAVVANEVRNLANQTKDATIEVSAVISRLVGSTATVVDAVRFSQSQAQDTVTKVQLTGQLLDAILNKVGTISEMNSHIAAATTQQRQAARQVGEVTQQLTGISQQAENQSERIVQISQGVSDLSSDLKRVTEQFEV
ncbi:methyl-accepting chemotaxis protein [Gammaproteobacteria bacterium]